MKSRLRQPLCFCHLTNFFFYFLFACLYTYTKLLLIHKEYFGPFSSRHFLIRAIVNLNLTFAVDVNLWVLQWSRMPETELNGRILNFLKAAQWALTTEHITEMEHEFSGARIHLKRPVQSHFWYQLQAFAAVFRKWHPQMVNAIPGWTVLNSKSWIFLTICPVQIWATLSLPTYL